MDWQKILFDSKFYYLKMQKELGFCIEKKDADILAPVTKRFTIWFMKDLSLWERFTIVYRWWYTFTWAASFHIRSKLLRSKGTTILFKFVYTFISSTGVDIVHAVFEGVTKKLIQVWIHKDFSGKDLSMSKYVHTISTRMETLQPPEFMRRCPRSDINES